MLCSRTHPNAYAHALDGWNRNNSTPAHFALLLNVYESLERPTESLTSVSRYGAHWERIGFQGNDPATDLRGAGMLSLLQMCFLLEKYKDECVS